jgi:hypothetical protein
VPAGSVHPRLLDDLRRLLPDFSDLFSPMERRVDRGPGAQEFGLAIFARRSLLLCESGQIPLVPVPRERASSGAGWESVGARPLQYCRIRLGEQDVWIGNVHGAPQPAHKLDTEERLEQTRRILEWLDGRRGEVVLVGDFNLLPDTESIALLERRLRSLIREYAIATTRSRLNPYRGTPREQKYADYAFVSAGISVSGFEVPDVAVSDHLPLILTLSSVGATCGR